MNEINKISRRISIGFSTSKSLAAHVVVYKTLGMDKEIALLCMQELVYRRNLGDDFKYEEFIEEEIKKIPQMKGLNLPEMGKKIMADPKMYKTFIGKNDS